jgi:hypothetical protein
MKRLLQFIALGLLLLVSGAHALTPGQKAILFAPAAVAAPSSFCASTQLCDEFSGTTKDLAKWEAPTTGPCFTAGYTVSGSEVEATGSVTTTPTASANTIEGRSSLTRTYTMVGKELIGELTVSPSTTAAWYMGYCQNGSPGQNFSWRVSNNFGSVSIEAVYSNSGDNGTNYSATFNATDHVCFRIREVVGDVFWDTSPAGCNTWTNRRQLSVDGGTPGIFFSPNNGDVGFWVHNYNSNGTPINVSTGSFKLTQ